MLVPKQNQDAKNFHTSCLRAIRVDLRRAVITPRFILAILLSLSWSLFNGIFDIFLNHSMSATGIPYVINQALTGDFGLGMLILSISAVPYSTSYLTDRDSNFFRYAVNRIGLRVYGLSKIIAVSIAAYLASIISNGLLLAILSLTGAPHVISGEENYLSGCYLDLVYLYGPVVYYSVRFTIAGLSCSMAAIFALMVSTLIPNSYVCLISPLVAYYGYTAIISLLSLFCNSSALLNLFVLNYIINTQVSQNNWFSFLWAVVYFLTVIILCSRCFLRHLEKEYRE